MMSRADTATTAVDRDLLDAFEGRALGEARRGLDAVNLPMIRHWVDAIGDANPIYLDAKAAQAAGRRTSVAPPAMLQVWVMPGRAVAPSNVQSELFELLDAHGFTAVVATTCEQEYVRELCPGDELTVTESIESVSDQKHTALGDGHFITRRMTYRDALEVVVAVQRWTIFKFRPAPPVTDRRPLRPRPAVNRDNAFWFEAAANHRLVIQRCSACGRLRHPPGPCCPACRSFEWNAVESSGVGTICSFVVNHHPRVPAFDYPLAVVLVELEEGARVISNVAGIDPDDLRVGLPVVIDWVDHDSDLSLPVFRPAPELVR